MINLYHIKFRIWDNTINNGYVQVQSVVNLEKGKRRDTFDIMREVMLAGRLLFRLETNNDRPVLDV